MNDSRLPPLATAQVRIRSALGPFRQFVGRRFILPVLAADPMRRATLSLARRRYALGDRPRRLIGGFLAVAQPTGEERAALSHSLVELFFDLIPAAGTSVFVEAGAKEASASLRAIESGVSTVVAFEANPYTHRRFAATVGAAGLDYRHAALATETGEATFLVRLRADGSAIADGQGSLLVRPDHQPGYEEVTVRAVTLDDQIAGDGRIAMWVDVEGAVAEVFGGGDRVLRRTDLLIVEVETVAKWSGQRWLVADVEAHLAKLGLEPVAADMQSRRQFNVLYVRSELLELPSIDALLERWRTGH